MKRSELRKIIREVISEQVAFAGNYCSPGNADCVEPYLTTMGLETLRLVCPEGFEFQHQDTNQLNYYDGAGGIGSSQLVGISRCVPDIGSPGDMAGHGSPDNPFVPGMGFEDQFIDQITGPGGPFGGKTPPPPIRESKKRRK